MGLRGQRGFLLEHWGCPRMALEGYMSPLATPRPPALTNVLNSGIVPRGPWPRH